MLFENDDTNDEFVLKRSIPAQNLVQRLIARETFSNSRKRSRFNDSKLYTNVFPNFTVATVEKPSCVIRKFSPDGRHLIAFSTDGKSVHVYEFLGSNRGQDILASYGISNNDILYKNSLNWAEIRQTIFNRIFRLRHVIPVDGLSADEYLSREVCLFTEDLRYLIVFSENLYVHGGTPPISELMTNNEAMNLSPVRSPMENYTLHCIDFSSGEIMDQKRFKCDKILLPNQQGISLAGNSLSVLSVQKQTIHLFRISPDGELILTHEIGRFCNEDDELAIAHLGSDYLAGTNGQVHLEIPYTALKHKLLAYLYQTALGDGPDSLRRFYYHFAIFEKLRMCRQQLLDSEHLLIRYRPEHSIISYKCNEANPCLSIYMVYSIRTTDVLAVFENVSSELLKLYEDFAECFHQESSTAFSRKHICFISNNVYSREHHNRQKMGLIGAKNGGEIEATKRILTYLPFGCQAQILSPYLDLSLFSYDDRHFATQEKTKMDSPVKFFARDSGILRFKLHSSATDSSYPFPASGRKYVTYIFHPFEPFALSMVKFNNEYVLNIHTRYCPA